MNRLKFIAAWFLILIALADLLWVLWAIQHGMIAPG